MPKHEIFKFKTLDDLLLKADRLGINIPVQERIDNLFESIKVGSKTIPNRIVVQPMEGFDSEPDGAPGELTFRRYDRYARGGSGMIWFEATSIVQEGRSNAHQLMLNKRTLDGFKRLVEQTRASATKEFGSSQDPYLVIQLTHSGRYSKPEGKPLNKVACHNPFLDDEDTKATLFSDDELDTIKDIFIKAVALACEAGFDAVDVKACHGYLFHELLGAHTRADSKYGGSFKNRTRLILDTSKEIKSTVPEILTAVRLNVTDGIPYPYGFGASTDGSLGFDLCEPKKLIVQLVKEGCLLLNVTAGIPYHSPHIVRPYNKPLSGKQAPEEHPLEGVARMIQLVGELQRGFPDIPFTGSAFSWLRQYWPYVGAAVLDSRMASLIGLGRGSFAYPDAPKDLMQRGKLNPTKCCIACSCCSELMRHGSATGCVARDKEIYSELYKRIKSA